MLRISPRIQIWVEICFQNLFFFIYLFFFLIPPKASAEKAAKTNVCFMEKPSPVCVMGLVMMLLWPGACQGTPQPYCCTQGASMPTLCLEVGFWAGGEMLSWTLQLAQVLL